MKSFRAVIASLAILVFNAVLGALTCGWLFNWVYQLEPTNVWKPMESPGVDFHAGMFVLNLLFVGVYLLLRAGIPGPNVYVKGLVYGLCVWVVGFLPRMFSLYIFMTVAPTVLVYWTIMGLIGIPLNGLIVAAICVKEPCCEEFLKSKDE